MPPLSPVLLVLLDASCKSAALLALVALFAVCLRKSSAAARHLAWCAAVAGTLVLPLLSMVLPAWRTPWLPSWPLPVVPVAIQPPSSVTPHPAPAFSVVTTAVVSHPAESSSPAPVAVTVSPKIALAPSAPVSPWFWTLPCWFAGTALALLPLTVGLWQMRRLSRRCAPVSDPAWTDLLARLSADLRLHRRVHLRIGPGVNAPLTWGAFRPVLLLPEEAATWTPERRRVVLLHELAHIMRWDWLTQTLAYLACALYWFNPLAWLAARQMRLERERACDDLVLHHGSRPSDYADELLHLAAHLGSRGLINWAAVPMARRSTLEGRLLAILDPRRNRSALTRAAVLAALALVAILIVPIAMLKAASDNSSPSATDSTQSLASQNQALQSLLGVSSFSGTYRPHPDDNNYGLALLRFEDGQLVGRDGVHVQSRGGTFYGPGVPPKYFPAVNVQAYWGMQNGTPALVISADGMLSTSKGSEFHYDFWKKLSGYTANNVSVDRPQTYGNYTILALAESVEGRSASGQGAYYGELSEALRQKKYVGALAIQSFFANNPRTSSALDEFLLIQPANSTAQSAPLTPTDPFAASTAWAPAIERIVTSGFDTDTGRGLNLATGEFVLVPGAGLNLKAEDLLQSAGVNLFETPIENNSNALAAVGLGLAPLPDQTWENATPADLTAALARAPLSPTYPPRPGIRLTPGLYAFSRGGQLGLLEIIGHTNQAGFSGVQVRYKFTTAPPTAAVTPAPTDPFSPSAAPAPANFNFVVDGPVGSIFIKDASIGDLASYIKDFAALESWKMTGYGMDTSDNLGRGNLTCLLPNGNPVMISFTWRQGGGGTILISAEPRAWREKITTALGITIGRKFNGLAPLPASDPHMNLNPIAPASATPPLAVDAPAGRIKINNASAADLTSNLTAFVTTEGWSLIDFGTTGDDQSGKGNLSCLLPNGSQFNIATSWRQGDAGTLLISADPPAWREKITTALGLAIGRKLNGLDPLPATDPSTNLNPAAPLPPPISTPPSPAANPPASMVTRDHNATILERRKAAIPPAGMVIRKFPMPLTLLTRLTGYHPDSVNGTIVPTRGTALNISNDLKGFFVNAGVDFPDGSRVTYENNEIIVANTPPNLDRLGKFLVALDQNGPLTNSLGIVNTGAPVPTPPVTQNAHPSPVTSSDQLAILLITAHDRYLYGDYVGALETLEKVDAFDPTNADAKALRAQAVHQLNPLGLETRSFPMTQATLARLTTYHSSNPGDPFSSKSSGTSSQITDDLKNFFTIAGVPFPDQTRLAYDGTKIWVTNTPANLDRLANLLQRYSIIKQVEIQTRLIQTRELNLQALGFQWGPADPKHPGNFVSFQTGPMPQLAPGSSPAVVTSIFVDPASGLLVSGPPASSLATATHAGTASPIPLLRGDAQLLFDALEQTQDTDLLTAPRVTVLNEKTAEIRVGQDGGMNAAHSPYATDFVGFTVTVLPVVEDDDSISYSIKIRLSDLDSRKVAPGGISQQTDIAELVASGQIPDGATIVFDLGAIDLAKQSLHRALPAGPIPHPGPASPPFHRYAFITFDRIDPSGKLLTLNPPTPKPVPASPPSS